MKRRFLVAGIAAGSIAVSGCIGGSDRGGADSNPLRPTEILESDFDTGVDIDAGPGDDPVIAVDRSDATVSIEGVGEYSSSSCGYLDPQNPDYDSDEAELSVEIRAARDQSDGETECEDDITSSSYRFVVRFDEGVPARVEAEHPFERSASREF